MFKDNKIVINSYSLSPGAKFKECTTVLNGVPEKQGFHRDKFYQAAEKTFDKKFGYKRNFVEIYKAKNMLDKARINVPTIPTNKVQPVYKALIKFKQGEFIVFADGRDKRDKFRKAKIQPELPEHKQISASEMVTNYKRIHNNIRSMFKA